MEQFSQVFGRFLVFVYHCFDRIVINGYLTGLLRPENAVYFFRDVLGHQAITPEVLRERTDAYHRWVEAFARNHRVPIEWAAKGVGKKTTSCPGCAGWNGRSGMASTSSSRAWSKARPFAPWCPSSPPPIPITVSSARTAAGSPITTSTSGTTCSGRL